MYRFDCPSMYAEIKHDKVPQKFASGSCSVASQLAALVSADHDFT